MIDTNRRSLFLAAGGLSVLAACKPVTPGGGGPRSTDQQPYGAFPDEPGEAHFKGSIKFDPKNICLVYLKIDAAKLASRHAYFAINAVAGDEVIWVKDRFAEMARGSWSTVKPIRENKDFVEFNFGSQQKIYFFIDNGDAVIFDDITPITFSPFSSKGGRPDYRKPDKPLLDKNFAFFSARMVQDKVAINPNLLYLENWFADKNGKVFDKNTPPENYSMDIHLKMQAYGTQDVRIPIIIDPDTGNGGHWRP